jgi:hypothetical protein
MPTAALPESRRPDLSDPHGLLTCGVAQTRAPESGPSSTRVDAKSPRGGRGIAASGDQGVGHGHPGAIA